jgi:hypothetical protein
VEVEVEDIHNQVKHKILPWQDHQVVVVVMELHFKDLQLEHRDTLVGLM